VIPVENCHAKGHKSVIRVDNIKKLIRALNTYFEYEKE
jgi:hypothetical protein